MNVNTLITRSPSEGLGLVSLTSDFGPQSEGVGVMKGTILARSPNVRVINLCHAVAPGSIVNGARILEAVRFLPVGTHVCVVDPGVGTDRRGVVLQTARGDLLIGPDNGVLRKAASALGGILAGHTLSRSLETGSRVFDGRDLFAYSAALLTAHEASPKDLGPSISEEDLVAEPFKDIEFTDVPLRATVLHVNRFGNIMLNISDRALPGLRGRVVEVTCRDRRFYATVLPSFGHAAAGEPIVCDDGFGRVCVALNGAPACDLLGAEINETVHILLKD